MKIGKYDLNERCFIIAEAGVNHVLAENDMQKIGAGSALDVACRMVDAAKEAGADAVKFQSFKTELLQLRTTAKPQYQDENVGTEVSYFDLIKSLETSQEDQRKIADHCKEKGIMFISTPYDDESADFLESLDVPAYKLASIELNNHLFLRYVAKKGRPIILSTGLSTMDDVRETVRVAREGGFVDRLILLQCTSNYPAMPEEINLNVLTTYKKEFPDVAFGFSDHSPTDTASIGAVALGACVVEKHFTLDNSFEGPDHSSSLDGPALKGWVSKVREISNSMGSPEKEITGSEKKNLSMRKFIVIKKGSRDDIIDESMLTSMRTGDGILPQDKNLKKIIGKRLKNDIKEAAAFDWGMIE